MRKNHKWARVDKYAVRGAMRWVFNNQDAARELGEFTRARLRVCVFVSELGRFTRARLSVCVFVRTRCAVVG